MAATDCIYCLGRRNDPKMTLEHVWPSSLGGKAAPASFRSNHVCRTCNNLAGLFVDAPFRKNWFVQNEGLAGHEFLDPDHASAGPLVYFGFDHAFPTDPSEVCERWNGPAGEHVYHIHAKDDARWETLAGGDFVRRKTSDGGRAYIVLTSQAEYWVVTALLSFAAWFPHASKRCMTGFEGDISALEIMKPDELPISAKEHAEIAAIRDRGNSQVLLNFPVQVDFADRFMAKLALGLAGSILGEAAVRSAYGNDLRTALWSRSQAERQNLALRGTGL